MLHWFTKDYCLSTNLVIVLPFQTFFLNDSFGRKFDTFIWNPLQGTRILKPQKFDIKLSK